MDGGDADKGIATAVITKKEDAFSVTLVGNQATQKVTVPAHLDGKDLVITLDDFSQIAGEANAEQFKDDAQGARRRVQAHPEQRGRDAPEPRHRGHDHVGTGLRRDHPAGQGRHRDHMNSRRGQAIERGAGGAPLRAPSRIRPATRGDAPEIVDLLSACDVAEVGEPDSTLEDLENDWSMEGFDLGRDAWVAEGRDGLVGYAYAGDQFRTGELEADLWVHPEHHEPELGGRLLGLAERRAAQLAVERGYPDPALDVFCIAGNRAKRDLLRRHGYGLKRTVYRMTADLAGGAPAAPVPEGLEIRSFRLDADERTMHDTMTEAFEDHFRRSNEPFEAWKTRLLGHADFDPGPLVARLGRR